MFTCHAFMFVFVLLFIQKKKNQYFDILIRPGYKRLTIAENLYEFGLLHSLTVLVINQLKKFNEWNHRNLFLGWPWEGQREIYYQVDMRGWKFSSFRICQCSGCSMETQKSCARLIVLLYSLVFIKVYVLWSIDTLIMYASNARFSLNSSVVLGWN